MAKEELHGTIKKHIHLCLVMKNLEFQSFHQCHGKTPWDRLPGPRCMKSSGLQAFKYLPEHARIQLNLEKHLRFGVYLLYLTIVYIYIIIYMWWIASINSISSYSITAPSIAPVLGQACIQRQNDQEQHWEPWHLDKFSEDQGTTCKVTPLTKSVLKLPMRLWEPIDAPRILWSGSSSNA